MQKLAKDLTVDLGADRPTRLAATTIRTTGVTAGGRARLTSVARLRATLQARLGLGRQGVDRGPHRRHDVDGQHHAGQPPRHVAAPRVDAGHQLLARVAALGPAD